MFKQDKIHSLNVEHGDKYKIEAIILHDGSPIKKDIMQLKQKIEKKIDKQIDLTVYTINGYSK